MAGARPTLGFYCAAQREDTTSLSDSTIADLARQMAGNGTGAKLVSVCFPKMPTRDMLVGDSTSQWSPLGIAGVGSHSGWEGCSDV